MASRRSLTTTTAVAGGLLAALCFVPSASATGPVGHAVTHHHTATARTAAVGERRSAGAMNLADTGSINTTPYLVGGSTFLAAGAALLVASRRRGVSLL
ncbi:LAETG motif-containing sortase-dependent surface protein [Streptantibioticus rubrisoli]|uniref:LPXTG cell wall anchor domain-containing protein n=1 Tax=Streptantibioticus rubrisoli TaxID=1387313 RepID=A0ABT1PDA8_9ACTN|nr:LAETG motif-containing sortase-dependent surface protein [Streptantibioticus rubrisoli]MCQ4043358.1 LPXTG cell wall anchor domain-containing protein [Streptantibioticus rubrisoli]